ncbi:hypothetical protein DB30_03663 [Enhygromyxa salina]|uniref:Wax synthase domain-containing protein n=1 Tax=Enhygromyxa salina TaxID=215803 RepID=A0A0C2D1F4_9BACT|nr:MBOAT family protein [Enhygromyxa salina]KIG17066.1 hypothetical protein DB30_03663 [Enhygromyxa salina]
MADLARLFVALAVWIAAVLACAYVSGREASPERSRYRGVAIAAIPTVAPLLLPPAWIVGRTILAVVVTVSLGRALDLARRPGGLSFWGRVWMLTALFDVRAVRRCSSRYDMAEIGWFAGHLVLAAGSWFAVFGLAPDLEGACRWALRWSCGLVLCYACIETVHALVLMIYRGFGLGFPRINDRPILSTTLSEFWGRRWNRAVSGWLHDNLFLPLARRRRAKLGICAAFAASTALHFWFAWVPLDRFAGALMASFFVVHGVGLLLERRAGVVGWPPSARRVWTAAWIAVPSPLFVEPALRLLAGFIPS